MGAAFGQAIGTDDYPELGGTEVSYVGEAGYATFYDATNGYQLGGDVKAYIGQVKGNYLSLTEIADIPASTAVVLKGTYYNKVQGAASATTIGNQLLGSDGTVTGASGRYVLANKTNGVGFYPVSSSGITIPAGKAYLDLGSPVKEFYLFSFEGETETAIENVNVNLNNGIIYNLAGQRINKLQKGINIVNGKKILK